MLGWKVAGTRTGDTSGGLSSDDYCRVDFASGGPFNVPMSSVYIAAAAAPPNARVAGHSSSSERGKMGLFIAAADGKSFVCSTTMHGPATLYKATNGVWCISANLITIASRESGGGFRSTTAADTPFDLNWEYSGDDDVWRGDPSLSVTAEDAVATGALAEVTTPDGETFRVGDTVEFTCDSGEADFSGMPPSSSGGGGAAPSRSLAFSGGGSCMISSIASDAFFQDHTGCYVPFSAVDRIQMRPLGSAVETMRRRIAFAEKHNIVGRVLDVEELVTLLFEWDDRDGDGFVGFADNELALIDDDPRQVDFPTLEHWNGTLATSLGIADPAVGFTAAEYKLYWGGTTPARVRAREKRFRMFESAVTHSQGEVRVVFESNDFEDREASDERMLREMQRFAQEHVNPSIGDRVPADGARDDGGRDDRVGWQDRGWRDAKELHLSMLAGLCADSADQEDSKTTPFTAVVARRLTLDCAEQLVALFHARGEKDTRVAFPSEIFAKIELDFQRRGGPGYPGSGRQSDRDRRALAEEEKKQCRQTLVEGTVVALSAHGDLLQQLTKSFNGEETELREFRNGLAVSSAPAATFTFTETSTAAAPSPFSFGTPPRKTVLWENPASCFRRTLEEKLQLFKALGVELTTVEEVGHMYFSYGRDWATLDVYDQTSISRCKRSLEDAATLALARDYINNVSHETFIVVGVEAAAPGELPTLLLAKAEDESTTFNAAIDDVFPPKFFERRGAAVQRRQDSQALRLKVIAAPRVEAEVLELIREGAAVSSITLRVLATSETVVLTSPIDNALEFITPVRLLSTARQHQPPQLRRQGSGGRKKTLKVKRETLQADVLCHLCDESTAKAIMKGNFDVTFEGEVGDDEVSAALRPALYNTLFTRRHAPLTSSLAFPLFPLPLPQGGLTNAFLGVSLGGDYPPPPEIASDPFVTTCGALFIETKKQCLQPNPTVALKIPSKRTRDALYCASGRLVGLAVKRGVPLAKGLSRFFCRKLLDSVRSKRFRVIDLECAQQEGLLRSRLAPALLTAAVEEFESSRTCVIAGGTLAGNAGAVTITRRPPPPTLIKATDSSGDGHAVRSRSLPSCNAMHADAVMSSRFLEAFGSCMSMALAAGEAEMSTVILPRWMMAALGLENDERVDLRKISPKTGPHYVAKEVRLVINSGTPHAHAPFHVLPFETLDSLRVGSSFVVADDESGANPRFVTVDSIAVEGVQKGRGGGGASCYVEEANLRWSAPPESEKPYSAGTAVTGLFTDGIRYPGVVQSYNAARKVYDILFDDGDRQRKFPESKVSFVRSSTPPAATKVEPPPAHAVAFIGLGDSDVIAPLESHVLRDALADYLEEQEEQDVRSVALQFQSLLKTDVALAWSEHAQGEDVSEFHVLGRKFDRDGDGPLRLTRGMTNDDRFSTTLEAPPSSASPDVQRALYCAAFLRRKLVDEIDEQTHHFARGFQEGLGGATHPLLQPGWGGARRSAKALQDLLGGAAMLSLDAWRAVTDGGPAMEEDGGARMLMFWEAVHLLNETERVALFSFATALHAMPRNGHLPGHTGRFFVQVDDGGGGEAHGGAWIRPVGGSWTTAETTDSDAVNIRMPVASTCHFILKIPRANFRSVGFLRAVLAHPAIGGSMRFYNV